MIRQPKGTEARVSTIERNSSAFVLRCIKSVELNRALPVLDIPCGFGRHALLLSERGYHVVGADIDGFCLEYVSQRARSDPQAQISLLKVDATSSLPFRSEAFGLAIIVHYVEKNIIASVEPLIAPGGYIIYETFGFNGNNWQQLPQSDEVHCLIAPRFNILVYEEKSNSRHPGGSVSVKAFARKKTRLPLADRIY